LGKIKRGANCAESMDIIEQIPIVFDLPGSNLTGLEGSYYLKNGKIHLALSAELNIPGYIQRIQARNKRNSQSCLFFKCQLALFGGHFDEYRVEETYLNQEMESFQGNAYMACRFSLTSNILPFFNPPWEFERRNDSRKGQILRFLDPTARCPKLTLENNTSLTINVGYQQQYSKIKYSVESSVAFELSFRDSGSRESAFKIAEAVASYYSLFCFEPVRVYAINLQVDAVNNILYFGQHALQQDKAADTGLVFIDQSDIRDYANDWLLQWIKDYEKYKIPSELARDAAQISDEQLRFICLTRALESFHKEFFFEKIAPGYGETLHNFLLSKDLTAIDSKTFLNKVTLSQRLYDLLRSLHHLIDAPAYKLKVGQLLIKSAMEAISFNRNHYTHFTRKKNDKIWSSEQLAPVNRTLTIFLRLLMLKQCGFSDPALQRVLDKWPNTYY
jgi:hypothetical protein